MREMDKDGLLLCEMQAKVFEKSIEQEKCSSSIFVRRYMNSKVCERMDSLYFIGEVCSAERILEDINEEYGASSYGVEKFSTEEMYWMGYIYRYFAYVLAWESRRIYKIINATELRKLYIPYHTLDPLNAIERILEAKEIAMHETNEDIIKRGVEILRKLRRG